MLRSHDTAVYLFLYALCVVYNRKVSVSNDTGNKKRNLGHIYFLIQHTSLSLLHLVHLGKDLYSPSQVYSSATILFIVVACFQFATNGKSLC